MKTTTSRLLLPLLLFLTATAVAPASAQQETETVIYLVRHAETQPDGSRDPALSAAGRERASMLARMLGAAGLDAVHTTPYRRTRQTAGPIAAATGLTAQEYDPSDLEAFAASLIGEGGRHLVVGHSNTTPALVRVLGGDPGSAMSEAEYGRVYVLTVSSGQVRTARLGYLADRPSAAGSGAEAGQGAGPLGRPLGAAAGDVSTIDGLLTALYDVISGPAGQERDWNRLRGLFLPSARMIPVQRAPDGRTMYRALTVDEYIETSGPVLTRIGFTEREVARRIDTFGDVAQVFSTYEGHREDQAEPLVRGINTIQLIYDGSRWWISSIAWSAARPDLPVPPEYEGPGGG